jgi:hypothetical protein
MLKITIKQWIKITAFTIQWEVRDTIAGILQDLAEWVAP